MESIDAKTIGKLHQIVGCGAERAPGWIGHGPAPASTVIADATVASRRQYGDLVLPTRRRSGRSMQQEDGLAAAPGVLVVEARTPGSSAYAPRACPCACSSQTAAIASARVFVMRHPRLIPAALAASRVANFAVFTIPRSCVPSAIFSFSSKASTLNVTRRSATAITSE